MKALLTITLAAISTFAQASDYVLERHDHLEELFQFGTQPDAETQMLGWREGSCYEVNGFNNKAHESILAVFKDGGDGVFPVSYFMIPMLYTVGSIEAIKNFNDERTQAEIKFHRQAIAQRKIQPLRSNGMEYYTNSAFWGGPTSVQDNYRVKSYNNKIIVKNDQKLKDSNGKFIGSDSIYCIYNTENIFPQ